MSVPRIGHRWTHLHRDNSVAGVAQGWPPYGTRSTRSRCVRWIRTRIRAAALFACSNEKAPNSVGAFPSVAGVHPPYAAEAFLFTPLRVATVFNLVFAAFSSFRFVVRRRTTSS